MNLSYVIEGEDEKEKSYEIFNPRCIPYPFLSV